MTGLSKITDKILDDARAEAAQRLARADEECARISAEYREKADKASALASASAKEEATEILSRAKASEGTLKKNITLKVQSDMIDRAFAVAKAELCGLGDEEKLSLLTDLLLRALTDEWESEQSRESIYGVDEDDGERFYEVMLNEKDRSKLGNALINNFRRRIVGKDLGDLPNRVSLSKSTVNIEGGLVIRVGSVEINCSIETIVERLRPSLEAKVSKILFP